MSIQQRSSKDSIETLAADCAQRLEALAQRCQAFFDAQLYQLEFAASRISHAADDAEAEAEWRQEQIAWEQKRATDEARIEEQLDHLARAWRELENEQRRLITSGQPLATQTMESPHAAGPLDSHESSSLDLVETTGRWTSASAAIQFQKLKRELRQHTRRPR